jgi:hypothetical protein
MKANSISLIGLKAPQARKAHSKQGTRINKSSNRRRSIFGAVAPVHVK